MAAGGRPWNTVRTATRTATRVFQAGQNGDESSLSPSAKAVNIKGVSGARDPGLEPGTFGFGARFHPPWRPTIP